MSSPDDLGLGVFVGFDGSRGPDVPVFVCSRRRGGHNTIELLEPCPRTSAIAEQAAAWVSEYLGIEATKSQREFLSALYAPPPSLG